MQNPDWRSPGTGWSHGRLAPFMAISAVVLMAAACGRSAPVDDASAPVDTPTPRVACANRDELRRPFFGDLHVHTNFSLDTAAFDLKNTPADAYAFARGEAVRIGVPDENGEPAYSVRLTRPLDFVAITDHAEYLGATHICHTPSAAGYNALECLLIRREIPGINRTQANLVWQVSAFGSPGPSIDFPLCLVPGIDCGAAESVQWREMQRAAAEAYDRSSQCGFTSFVAFEWTATPLGDNLHRNVIFANDVVTSLPISTQDTGGPYPARLWSMLDEQCIDAGNGCDALIIPHNPNLSNGLMFQDPSSPEQAATRARMEPLVEMIQHKGASECRLGVGTSDEQCAFERTFSKNLFPNPAGDVLPTPFAERAFVRNVLKDGMALRETYGLNPFKLGFVGSTDTHFGTPGLTGESGHLGHHHVQNDQAQQLLQEIDSNPGGLAVVWAEENTRESLFAALRRKETYGTSGTRPILRMFAGWDLPADLCRDPAFEAIGYARGVPMGGDLSAQDRPGTAAPQLAISASQDAQSLPLERIQVVKGWVDAAGQTQETVFDVAGEVTSGLGVDPESCAPSGHGAPALCTVWNDPDFDPDQPAFYYTRILEAPSCRWSTQFCQAHGVNPLSAACSDQAAVAGEGYEACCDATAIQPVIQERAWSSPVWYEP